jgi:hypothetical protein
MKRTSTLAAALVGVVALAPARESRADDAMRCPPMSGAAPALSMQPASLRLDFVRSVMRDQARRARLWSWGWALGGTALIAGNYAIAALADTADDRVDPIVGGTAAITIPAGILIKPLTVMSANDELEDYLARTASTAGARDACVTLARAEELLAISADDEALTAGWIAQVLAIGGNAAIGLFLGLGFDHWEGALLNGVGGIAVSEAQIFTQPTGAVSALERYRRGVLQARGEPTATFAWHVTPWLGAGAARGVTVGVSF